MRTIGGSPGKESVHTSVGFVPTGKVSEESLLTRFGEVKSRNYIPIFKLLGSMEMFAALPVEFRKGSLMLLTNQINPGNKYAVVLWIVCGFVAVLFTVSLF